MTLPRLLVFASGTAEGGGSGFRALADAARAGTLRAEIVGAVSNHRAGGVMRHAVALDVPFISFPGPWGAKEYRRAVDETGAEWCALSGWLKLAVGLDPSRTFNIHPGPLPRFGGKGMHGRHVHEAVLDAYRRGEIARSEACMHFVTGAYDEGPVFFRKPVEILPDDTPETLGRRVNAVEHLWQARVTDLVVNGVVRWDGEDPASLHAPPWLIG